MACLVCAGMLGRPWGVPVGWVLQGCVLLTGLVVPAMLVLGVVFGALWVAAVRYGRKVDAIKASRAPSGPGDNWFVDVGGPHYGRNP